MPLATLGLILLSAIMHASWNLVVKRARNKQVFMWWSVVVGSVCFAVFLIGSSPLPVRVWPYIVASATLEAMYFVTLTLAYDIGDFSLIYPIARGAAPALLAIWTALFLAEPPRPGGLLGLALLVFGLIVIGSSPLWARRSLPGKHTFSIKGIVIALFTACCVSLYTTVDGAAVRFAPPFAYTIVVLGLSAVLFSPVVLLRYGARQVYSEWRVNWWRILLVGIFMLLTYVLVLNAYAVARVSYAGAIREVSVVFAALLGWLLLGEGFGLVRTIGAVLIFAGIVVIATLG